MSKQQIAFQQAGPMYYPQKHSGSMPAVRVRTSMYSWGSAISIDNSNYWDSGLQAPRDVGFYEANPWGFFDIHGNVFEWVRDSYSIYDFNYSLDPFFEEDDETEKVFRGGSWTSGVSGKNGLRSARRDSRLASVSGSSIGFRLAFKEVTQQEIDLNASAQNLYAYEDKPVGTAVGVLVTDASDRGVSNKYSLKSNYPDESNFSIRGNILYSADVFDFETKQPTRLE